MHATGRKPNWTWAATAIIFVIIMWLSSAPGSERPELQMSAIDQRFASAQGFEAASNAVVGRCSMCHTAEPSWPGIHGAPKGVVLDTPQGIAAHAREIYLQAGRSHAMPPGNVTEIEPAERRAIIDWYRAAVAG